MGHYEGAPRGLGETPAESERELLKWAASFSSRAEAKLRRLELFEAEARAKARRDRDQLEWLATISDKHELELRALQRKEAQESNSQEQRFIESQAAWEAWDPSKHPRLGGPPNAGWWASTGGSGGGFRASPHHGLVGNPKQPDGVGSPEAGRSGLASASGAASPFRAAAYRGGPVPVQLVANERPGNSRKAPPLFDSVVKRNHAVAVACSPKADPCVMRVPRALRGKETLDEKNEAPARADHQEAA
ncbi:MAG TPA: hypothetical protein VHY91_19385 [Pirellulales bacterium]|jgi:hypothetical protein|nr:hypothetical protein [Pirellulales bacterium]